MKTILVYHHYEEVRQNIKNILSSCGYTVLLANEIIEAVNYYATKNVDLIVSVPELLGYLNRDSSLPLRAPFVALLDRFDARLAVELLQKGFRECLCPPYRQVELVGTVQYLLGEEPTKIKKRVPVPFWLPFVGVLFLVCWWWFFGRVPKVQFIDLPYNEPLAIIADKDFVWISDWYTQSIYQYEQPVRGARYFKLLSVYHFSDFGPVALARKDNILYSIGNDGILRRHTGNEQLTPEVVADLKLTGVVGMNFTDNYLWVITENPARIYQYLIGPFTLFRQWSCPDIQPVGLEIAEEGFFTVDSYRRRVVRLEISDDKVSVKKNVSREIPPGKITAFAILKKRAMVILRTPEKQTKLFCFDIKK